MLDTYWGASEPTELSDTEAATAEFMFKLADYDELDRHSHSAKATWEKYAPADRQVITHQHGLQHRWFIRKGASPDWATQLSNAQGVVDAYEYELGCAQRRLQWARDDLANVLEAAAAAGHVSEPQS
ncbi:hypothetical protein B5566_02600 [Mycobacterium sp. MHSD3]|nr:hypothetical protein B5566_02600 [Mycobacterium sp. MHSD3]